jgi:DnaK suppressor protein
MSTDTHYTSDRDALRDMLRARRDELIEALQSCRSRLREKGADAPFCRSDEDDACDLDVRLVEIHAATLHRIDLAIERIDDGQYGRCTRCRGRISDARLRALPFAVHCQECESAREGEAGGVRVRLRKRLWDDGFDAGSTAGPGRE